MVIPCCLLSLPWMVLDAAWKTCEDSSSNFIFLMPEKQFLNDFVYMQIASIKDQIKSEQTASTGAMMELLFPNKALRQAMIIGWGVAFFQQANGSEVWWGCRAV